jgi:hypothetical protein
MTIFCTDLPNFFKIKDPTKVRKLVLPWEAEVDTWDPKTGMERTNKAHELFPGNMYILINNKKYAVIYAMGKI